MVTASPLSLYISLTYPNNFIVCSVSRNFLFLKTEVYAVFLFYVFDPNPTIMFFTKISYFLLSENDAQEQGLSRKHVYWY